MRTNGFIAMALLVAGAVGWWLITSSPRGDERGGAIPLRDQGHAILLLVDATGIADSKPRREAERWAELEWVNILTQGFGGCDVADIADIGSRLDDRQLVVVPRRTASRITAEIMDRLGTQVRAGLQVMFEAPDSGRCKDLGLELAAVERRPRLPWPRPVITTGSLTPTFHPRPVDVPWTRMRYAPMPLPYAERPTVQLSLDGRPLGWVKKSGQGSWIVLGMDFAELALRLRQGTGLDHTAVLPASDDAWLDAWVEGICGGTLTDVPLPRLATAPYDADGWLVSPLDPVATGSPGAENGWAFGSGVPFASVTQGGLQLDSLQIPVHFNAAPSALDLRRVDRWLRKNVRSGAGPVRLELPVETDPTVAEELAAMRERYDHAAVTQEDLRAWWELRGRVRLRSEAVDDDVVIQIVELPADREPSAAFAILVPLRWRDRSLAGWDADWGMAPGRRVQRFDRNYRLIRIDPAVAGETLRLHYR